MECFVQSYMIQMGFFIMYSLFNKILIGLTIINTFRPINCYGMEFLEQYQNEMLSKSGVLNSNITSYQTYPGLLSNNIMLPREKQEYLLHNSSFENFDINNNDEIMLDNEQNNANNAQHNNANNTQQASNIHHNNEFGMDIEGGYIPSCDNREEIDNITDKNLHEQFIEEETDNIIQSWISNNISIINDNILNTVRSIFYSTDEVNKLLFKFNKMHLNDMEEVINKTSNIIHTDNLLWHIINLSKNIKKVKY